MGDEQKKPKRPSKKSEDAGSSQSGSARKRKAASPPEDRRSPQPEQGPSGSSRSSATSSHRQEKEQRGTQRNENRALWKRIRTLMRRLLQEGTNSQDQTRASVIVPNPFAKNSNTRLRLTAQVIPEEEEEPEEKEESEQHTDRSAKKPRREGSEKKKKYPADLPSEIIFISDDSRSMQGSSTPTVASGSRVPIPSTSSSSEQRKSGAPSSSTGNFSERQGPGTSGGTESEDEEIFECEICGQVFLTFAQLHEHVYERRKKGQSCYYFCPEIAAGFEKIIKAKNLKFACPFCPNETFKNFSEVGRHLKKFHLKDKEFICPLCKAKFENLRCFQLHYYDHLGHAIGSDKGPLTCIECSSDNEFPGKRLYLQHMRIKHKEVLFPYKCGTCRPKLAFKSRATLERHKAVEHVHDCPDCPMSFKSKRFYDEHHRVYHTEPSSSKHEKPFKCPKCRGGEVRFASAIELSGHIAWRHQQRYTVQCSTCELKFSTKKKYEEHRINYCRDYPTRCPKCHEQFGVPGELVSHLNRGKCKYTCSECKRKFGTEESLSQHLNDGHEPDNEHACPKCLKTFREKTQRDKHAQRCKKVSKQQFKCPYCDAVYKNKDAFYIHQEGHFKRCHVCDDLLQTEIAYSKHLVDQHGYLRCDECDAVVQDQLKLTLHKNLHRKRKGNADKL